MERDYEELVYKFEFDDSLFSVIKAIAPDQQKALKAMQTQVFGDQAYADSTNTELLRTGDYTPDSYRLLGGFYPDFIQKVHFCFDNATIKVAGRGEDWDKYTDKVQKASDTYNYKDVATYLQLSAALYQKRFRAMPPVGWGDGRSCPPFSQLLFVLSCVTRLKMRKFAYYDNKRRVVVRDSDDLSTHAKHMPDKSVLNRLVVDLPGILEGITAPPSTTNYVFDEDGEIWKEREQDEDTETVGLRVLLAQLLYR